MGLCQVGNRLYQGEKTVHSQAYCLLFGCGEVASGLCVRAANLPMKDNGNFGPGCLMQLDTSGKLVGEATDAAASFVWGLSCTSNGGKVRRLSLQWHWSSNADKGQDCRLCKPSLRGLLPPLLQDTLFVSSVGNPAAGTASSGRRLAATAPAPAAGGTETGSVVRYSFEPSQGSTWSLGKGVTLISGLTSTPDVAGLSGGTVAPGREPL